MRELNKADWTGDLGEYLKQGDQWFKTDEEMYYHFLEQLPPAEQGKNREFIQSICDIIGGIGKITEYFLVGEPYTHVEINGKWAGKYLTFVCSDNGYFCIGYTHKKEFDLVKG